MVRKEPTHAVDRLTFAQERPPISDAFAKSSPEANVEHWLHHLRLLLPPDAFVTATIQAKPQYGYLASFRVRLLGQTLSSEARAETADRAVEEAGRGLCSHLPGDLGFSTEEDVLRAS